jgi:tRNA (guanine37-N1)-methyltransferase
MEQENKQQNLQEIISKDPMLIQYHKFKNEFIKNEILLGVKFNKNITNFFTKILKSHKIPYKNFNPIKHSKNSNENIYITKYQINEKETLIKLIENSISDEKKKNENITYEITEENIILTIKNFSYEEILKNFFEYENETNIKNIPSGFEIIGKIAHMNLKEEYLKYKYVIGELILEKNPSIKTVINKIGKIENIYRTYNMEILSGEENYFVEHKEDSIIFKFDIRKTYWCSRLQNERSRILNLISKNNILLDAFCGVGPLSLRACKKGIKVFSNDLNPDCYKYLNDNIKYNKINKDLIKTYNMDAREFIKIFIEKSKKIINDDDDNLDNNFPYDIHIDHIYMNLPKDAIEFLDVFIGLFKGCKENIYNKDNLPIVHVYGFAKSCDNPIEELKERISKAFNLDFKIFKEKCESDILNIENVRDISNRKVVYCVDMKIPYIVAYGLNK